MNSQQTCQQLRVVNETYIKANGLYLIDKDLTVSWDERKPVYKLVGNIDRVIFFNVGEGWCIGKKTYTKSGRYWYKLGRNNELGTDIAWKTSLGKSNTKVKCVTENKPYRHTEKPIRTTKPPNQKLKTTPRNKAKLNTLDKTLILIATIAKFVSEGSFHQRGHWLSIGKDKPTNSSKINKRYCKDTTQIEPGDNHLTLA